MRDTVANPAIFVERHDCISCGSRISRSIGSGLFGEEPLRSFIDGDPWGENPLAVLERERWDFRECSDCGQRWHARILSPQWNEVRFSKWMSADAIRQFETDHGGNHDAARDVQHVLRLRKLGVTRILDFGCGFGQFLEMCRLFRLEAHGVDRSSARRSGAGVQIHAELEDVPGTFDAITLFEVLEHLDDPMTTLLDLKTRLNPGGLMIVEVPDTSGVSSFTDRQSYYKIHPLDHINAFTPESLVGMMSRAGFRPLKKDFAFVTTSLKRVAKDVAKSALKQRTTQRYFTLA
ncbi:MAG TPA: class I SAM-dependent methyltransferase [Chthoniobacterales bacterium]|nr:class I SAM-dependent methyltransferase [Chthoniobacterales bacterium]